MIYDGEEIAIGNTNITTDQNGKAKVSFYTSDINGKYTVKIAGLNADGQLGDGTFKLNKAAHENN